MSSLLAVFTVTKPPAPPSICVDERFDNLWHFQCVVSPRTIEKIRKSCTDVTAGVHVQKLSPNGSPRSPLPALPRPGSFRIQANGKEFSICCDEFSGSDKSSPSSTDLSPRVARSNTESAFFEDDPGSPTELSAVPATPASWDEVGALAATESETVPSPGLAELCNSQAERQVLEGVFHTFDENRDGKISIEELRKAFQNLGISKTQHALTFLLETMTLKAEGYVDEDEFVFFYKAISSFIEEVDDEESKSDADRDLREAFQLFDKDKNGLISPTELQSVLCCLGFSQAKELNACVEMISRVDENGDGQVDFSEFKKMFGVENKSFAIAC